MIENNNYTDYLIFTDLDGTLLNHENYSFEDASEMLSIIKKNNIPLIIVTSKTKDEVILLQKRLDIKYPFIIENGAGVFIPSKNDYEIIALGTKYQETIEAFQKYSQGIDMKGFSQMSDQEVSSLTGLSIDKAALARKRTFSEPFILGDITQLESLKIKANQDGFDIVKGGRFYHLISLGQDKANALKELHAYYEKLHNKTYKTIALGDGENDLTMLEAADQAVLIKRFDDTFIDCNIKNVIKTDDIGPKGWNESLKRYFSC
ncbi:HAD-IIB family hydrolase [Arcobacteraceae bacterium]|nr:HAD-IIB family hydrolase [Arcobacteraceae bacterium]